MELPEGVQDMKLTITIPRDMAYTVPINGVQKFPSRYDFDFSQLGRLAVHRGLRSFEVTHVLQLLDIPVEPINMAWRDMYYELKRVGELLVPGGEVVLPGSQIGWRKVVAHGGGNVQRCVRRQYKCMVKRP
jgi:hypothetical protein